MGNSDQKPKLNLFPPKSSFDFAIFSWILALVVFLSFMELVPGGLLPYAMYPSFIFASFAIWLGKKEISAKADIREAKQSIIMGWVLWIMGGGSVIAYIVWAFVNRGPD